MFRTCFAPRIQQHTAHIWIFDTQRAVHIPGEDNPPGTPTRFIERQIRLEPGIIDGLHFPGDDSIFHVHEPRTSAHATHPVGTADYCVMLPSVTVEILPGTSLGIDQVFDPTHRTSL